jgi:hypothetical protein
VGKSARYIFTDPVEADRASIDRKLAVEEAYRKGVAAGEYFRAEDEHLKLDHAEAAAERNGTREGVREALHAAFAEIGKPSSCGAVDALRPSIARILCGLPCILPEERIELVNQVIADLKGSLITPAALDEMLRDAAALLRPSP